jgi:hypothetical protein
VGVAVTASPTPQKILTAFVHPPEQDKGQVEDLKGSIKNVFIHAL